MADYSGAYGGGFIETPGMHHIRGLQDANKRLEARIAALEVFVAVEKQKRENLKDLLREIAGDHPSGRHARSNKTTQDYCQHGNPTGSGRQCRPCSYDRPA